MISLNYSYKIFSIPRAMCNSKDILLTQVQLRKEVCQKSLRNHNKYKSPFPWSSCY
ncbi:hypothetical protein MtrunA17_Chr1g0168891 [Medicago truncatula]|uniref:Uncharacterized protein n=1 Tax=Medicago truncatula TaxID=3880 RepID=A0A396JR81_MEDTR|nr:hypothetical protein MtrunA17_Chr1g0168891 [Medicago truncatula]